MGNGSSNFATWQKVAVIFIVIFGVIIAFSYFQSSHVENSDTTTASYVPSLEETTSTAPTIEVASPTVTPAQTTTAPSSVPAVSEQKIQDIGSNIQEKAPTPIKTTATASSPAHTKSTKTASTSKPSAGKGTYKIQIASFKEAEKANKLLAKLKSTGYDAKVIESNRADQGIWHQVMVGPFSSKSDAETKLSELKNTYKESFIKRQ